MSEETEGQDTGAEAVAGGVDPAAAALALSGASREDAGAFLKDQRALIADQRHHLHEQFKHLHLSVWEKQLGVLLRVATAVVGIAFASGIALMVWDAAHSKGLIIEPFSVPPEMAERGLNGQVVAAQLLDKLSILGASESSRATQSYANNWGDNIKVEIPETGVSIGEMQRFLRGWLGHDIHISGEVYRTATGIAVTARAGAKGATFTGAETDLDTLVEKAAEHVFETTQPYRYANYLDRNYNPAGLEDRVARATAIYRRLIAGNDPVERAWAWNGLGTIAANIRGDISTSATDYRKAIASAPDFTIGYFALASRDRSLNREESALADYQAASRLLHRASVPDLDPNYLENARAFTDASLPLLTGDFAAAFPIAKAGAELPNSYSVLSRGNFIRLAALSLAQRHDGAGLRRYLQETGATYHPSPVPRTLFYTASEDWQAIVPLEAGLRQRIAQSSGDNRTSALANYDSQRAPVSRLPSPIWAGPRPPRPSSRRAPRIARLAWTPVRVSPNSAASMPVPITGSPSPWAKGLRFPSPMPTGAWRSWRAASRTRPSRNSSWPTRKARTSPTRWKAGARR